MAKNIKPNMNHMKLEDNDDEEPGTIYSTKTGDPSIQTEPEKILKIKQMHRTIRELKPNKYFISIKLLLKEMKLHIFNNMDIVPCEVIVEKLVIVLEKIIENLLIDQKKITAREVNKLFRKVYPSQKDSEFLNNVVQWILNGVFDKEDYLENLIIRQQETHGIFKKRDKLKIDDNIDIKLKKVHIKKEDDIKTAKDKNVKEEFTEPVNMKTEIIEIVENQNENMSEVIAEAVEIKPDFPEITKELNTIDDAINSCGDINNETEIKTKDKKRHENITTTVPKNAEKMPTNTSAENFTSMSPNTVETPKIPEESIDSTRNVILNHCPNNQATDD